MAKESQKECAYSVRIEEHLGLVRFVVSKFHRGRFVEDSDLYSAGCMALVEARTTYDPSRSKFSTWATRLIRQRVIEELRRKKRDSCSGELQDIADDDSQKLPVHLVPRILKGHENTDAGRMMVGHYMDGKSLSELGREFGISKESVRQRIGSAVSAIRRKNRSILENFV